MIDNGSAYIGRVGGLAAALGIGVAVMWGCGTAFADTAGPSGSDSPSKSVASPSATTKHAAPGSRSSASPTASPATSPGKYRATSHAAKTVTLKASSAAVSTEATAATTPIPANTPATPPLDSPATLTALAVSRKQTLSTAAVPVGSTVAAVTTAPTPGTAILQTPPLAFLQQIPVLGPTFVTPIVAAIHQIPVLGDLLHPFIGYPVQAGLPPGSPVARDIKLTSFDGTQIYVHFMPATGLPAGVVAPTIFEGPGLGMPGSTSLNGTPLDGILTDNLGGVQVGTLRAAGYNVVTWDPRGEFYSGGQAELDSPDFEAKDVSAIIDWVATQPEVQLDGTGDPRFGMVGFSYGGGIQLVTAAIDHRVDAIVPSIAWNTLNTSLYKGDAFKSGWGALLSVALLATFARPNPAIYPAAIYGLLTGSLTQDQQDLLTARGPGDELIGDITAPTLFIQGTVDTLFSLQEANLNALAFADDVPTKVIWFCGGHGLCTNNLLDPTDGELITNETLAWLAHYVKEDTDVLTGPQFEWVDQTGQYYSSNTYPAADGDPITVSSNTGGVLPLVPFLGGSGPLLFVLPIGGTKALNAYNLSTPAVTTTTHIVGTPQLSLTYSGVGVGNHIYAQLVDDATGQVLGNQTTPIPVTLDGQTHMLTIPLEEVAATLEPGQKVTLQVVASTVNYETLWTLGTLNVSSVSLTLPTIDDAVPVTTV
jgi:ABC-2 type transport system ATP-binding protein